MNRGLVRVLVAGSLSRQQSRELEAHFQQTCRKLGEAIARKRLSLLIGSVARTTADLYALEGYLAAGGRQPMLVRPDRLERETDQRWRDLTPSTPEAAIETLSEGASDTLWRRRACRLANGVVLVGGKGGTSLIRTIAERRAQPCVGLPDFEGPARDQHATLEQLFRRAHANDLLEPHAALGERPEATLEVLERMLAQRERLFPPIVGPDLVESHVYRALSLAATSVHGPATAAAALLAIQQVETGGEAFGVFRKYCGELAIPLSTSVPAEQPLMPEVPLDPSLMQSLRIAWAAVPKHKRAWGRMLVTAALFDRGVGRDSAWASTVPALRSLWRDYVLTQEREFRDSWEDAFQELDERLAIPEAPPDVGVSIPGIAVAQPGNDDPWNRDLRDHLKVEDEAKAFARLAAMRLFKPPLAVGIFGDWGAGKSFFMRLVHDHIEQLSLGTAGRDKAPEAGDGLFHTDIVQVRFNAWHYAETNLWASLVDHLFTELDRWLRRKQDPKGADPLLESLSTARELTLNAVVELVERRREQRHATQQLDAAERELASARDAVSRSPVVLLQALRTAVSANPNLAAIEKRFREAAKDLGWPEATQNAAAFEAVHGALEDEAKRAQVVRSNIVERLLNPWLAALFVLACLVAPVALSALRSALSEPWPALKAVNDGVLGASAILASATSILGGVLAWVRGSLTTLERATCGLDVAIESQLETQNSGVTTKQKELHELRARTEEARARLSSSTLRLAEATREYASGTGSGRLRDFIRARATDGQYARHLGLIATIRKDFEELASHLSDASKQARDELDKSREDFKKRVDQLFAATGDLLEEAEKKQLRESVQPEKPVPANFERIVLYIDDLDRCSPTKVVDVLQALHLLLTFPLFVVFVAVDVRWVSRSLETHYGDVLQRADDENRLRSTATARDYLEKIFQIPYWIRPMSGEASIAFIGAHAAVGAAPPAPASVPPPTTSPPAAEAAVPPVEGSVSVPDGAAPPPAGTLSEPSSAIAAELRPAGSLLLPAPPATAPITAAEVRTLTLSEAEDKQLRLLAPTVGSSPRRALRFLNVYRVVKASLRERELDQLHAGGYRALMTQLAIATGAPSLLNPWLATLDKDQSSDKRRSVPELRAAMGQHDGDSAELARLLAALDCYIQIGNVGDLDNYAPIVKRYSFSG